MIIIRYLYTFSSCIFLSRRSLILLCIHASICTFLSASIGAEVGLEGAGSQAVGKMGKNFNIFAMILLFFFVFGMLSSNAFAYQVFTNNSDMSNDTNFFFIQDLGYNATDQMCMNVTNDGSASTFTNLYCPSGTLAGYIFSAQPLSTYEYVKSANQSLGLSYYYNQSKSFLIPKNRGVVIYVKYGISNNSGMNPVISNLHWAFFGGSTGSSTAGTSTGINTAVAYLNPSTSDRHLVATLDLYFNGSMATGLNITIDKFWIYTLDVTESRELSTIFTNTTADAVRYCGSGYSQIPMAGGYCGWSGYYYVNNTGFFVMRDVNDQYCGIFAFNGLVVARHLDAVVSSLDSLCVYNVGHPQYGGFMVFKAYDPFYFVTHLVGGPLAGVLSASELFTSVQLRSMIVTTFVSRAYSYSCPSGSGGPFNCGPRTGPQSEDYGNSAYAMPSGTLDYNGTPVNHVDISFLASVNCTDPPNDYCNFNSPYNFTFVNTTPYSTYPNPAGTGWKYSTSPYYPFFMTEFEVENVGWSCNVATDYEFFTTSHGDITEYNYCGECGCAGDGFGYRCVQGTDHWECHNVWEAWHYTALCDNDLQLVCDVNCTGNQCFGEQLCINDSDCSSYCDGSMLYYSPYCNFGSYTCGWSSSQNCTYGCSGGACSSLPLVPVFQNRTTLGIISEITGGVLGFLSFTANPLLSILFIAVIAIIIIGVFSLFAYIAKHIGDI